MTGREGGREKRAGKRCGVGEVTSQGRQVRRPSSSSKWRSPLPHVHSFSFFALHPDSAPAGHRATSFPPG
eukprot:3088108-Rhodomonas_salina.1